MRHIISFFKLRFTVSDENFGRAKEILVFVDETLHIEMLGENSSMSFVSHKYYTV